MCTSEVNTRAQRKRANKEGLPKRAQNGRSNGVFKTADQNDFKEITNIMRVFKECTQCEK